MKQLSFIVEVEKSTSDDQILQCFKDSMEQGKGCWLSRKQIAILCERKVTPSLINRLEKLVDSGALQKDQFELRNKARGYAYALKGCE